MTDQQHPSLDPNEADPVVLWAEIWRLREALKGPDGFETWQQAAISERLRRVRAEARVTELEAEVAKTKEGT